MNTITISDDIIKDVAKRIAKELKEEKEERHYIKIYADLKPEEIAEKIYCICVKEELNQIIEALKEYMEDKEE